MADKRTYVHFVGLSGSDWGRMGEYALGQFPKELKFAEKLLRKQPGVDDLCWTEPLVDVTGRERRLHNLLKLKMGGGVSAPP